MAAAIVLIPYEKFGAGQAAAVSPAGVFWKATKPGRSSIRASQALISLVSGQVDVPFGGAGDVAVERHVGDGRPVTDQPGAARQFGVDVLEDGVGAGDDLFGVEAGAEHGDQAGRSGAEGDLAGGNRQPALDRGGAGGVLGKPVGPAELQGEIDQDGVGVRHDRPVIVEYRDLPEPVELEVFRRLVRAFRQIDLDQFGIGAEQREKQASPVRMTGQGMMIELHDHDSLGRGDWIRL